MKIKEKTGFLSEPNISSYFIRMGVGGTHTHISTNLLPKKNVKTVLPVFGVRLMEEHDAGLWWIQAVPAQF